MTAATAATIFTLSRTAYLLVAILWLSLLKTRPGVWRYYPAAAAGIGVFATIAFFTAAQLNQGGNATFSMMRIQSMFGVTADTTGETRIDAALRFLHTGMMAPVVGLGTGTSESVQVGPHNQFIALWASNGVIGFLLCVTALATLTFAAVRRTATILIGSTAMTWTVFLLSHTALVDPHAIIVASIALAATVPPTSMMKGSPSSPIPQGRHQIERRD